MRPEAQETPIDGKPETDYVWDTDCRMIVLPASTVPPSIDVVEVERLAPAPALAPDPRKPPLVGTPLRPAMSSLSNNLVGSKKGQKISSLTNGGRDLFLF